MSARLFLIDNRRNDYSAIYFCFACLLFTVFINQTAIFGQLQNDNWTPPFESPPQLKTIRQDSFPDDSVLSDYTTNGEVSVHDGAMILQEDSAARLSFRSASWCELKFTLDPTKGIESGDQDLRIAFDFTGPEQISVQIRNRTKRGANAQIRIIQTNDETGQFETLRRYKFDHTFDAGEWKITYRYGSVTIESSQLKETIYGSLITNGELELQAVALEEKKSISRIDNLSIQATPAMPVLSDSQLEKVARAKQLQNAGGLQAYQGRYEQATRSLQESMRLYSEVLGKAHPDHTLANIILSGVYRQQADYVTCERMLVESRRLLEQTVGDNHVGYATATNNLAELYFALGDFTNSTAMMVDARVSLGKVLGKQNPSYAMACLNEATAHLTIGNFDLAESVLREGISIFENSDDPLFEEDFVKSRYGYGLKTLGRLYVDRGEHSKAFPVYEQALAIIEKYAGQSSWDYQQTLLEIGEAHMQVCNYDVALAHFQSVIENSPADAKVTNSEANRAFSQISRVELMQGNTDRAIAYSQRALTNTRKNLELYSILQSENQQRQFTEAMRVSLDLYFTIILENELDPKLALEQLINWKGSAFLRQKKYRDLAQTRELKELFDELRKNSSLLIQLLEQPFLTSEENTKVDKLMIRKMELEQAIAKATSEKGNIDDSISTKQFLELIPDGAIFVDTLRFYRFERIDHSPQDTEWNPQEHYLALKVDKTNSKAEVSLIDLGDASELDAAIVEWRTKLQSNSSYEITNSAAAKVKELIWTPVIQDAAQDQLVIFSSDGSLGTIPIAALPGKSGNRYLIEEVRLANLSAPVFLKDISNAGVTKASQEFKALFVGGLDYGVTSNQLTDIAANSSRSGSSPKTFSPLKATSGEVAEISTLFSSPTILNGQSASKEMLLDEIPDHQILHFATHGFFNESKIDARQLFREVVGSTSVDQRNRLIYQNPNMLSGIALSGANHTQSGNLNEGILYADEISSFPLSGVELVVLSACETKIGTSAKGVGEGLLGMQRAFQVAGAKSTVASLWKVNDEATKRLMIRFYSNWERQKMNKLDALRDAQIWMLTNQQSVEDIVRGDPIDLPKATILNRSPDQTNNFRAHPKYWAAWILSGSWK